YHEHALHVAQDLTIVAQPGVAVDGDALGSVFLVDSGVTASLSGLEIRNGRTANGGGVSNAGKLRLGDATVPANARGGTGSGGGIHNAGTMMVRRTTISANSVDDILDDAFTGNRGGGGVYNSGTLTMVNCTLWGNQSSGVSPSAIDATNSGGGLF